MKRAWNGGFRGFKGKSVPPVGSPEGGGVRYGTLSPAELTRGRITVGRALEAHLQSLRARNYSPHTIRGSDHWMRAFLRLSGLTMTTPLVEVTPALAERAMARLSRKHTPGTAWRYATGWVQIFRAFTAAGLLLENPFARVDWPRRPRSLPRTTLGREEMEKLLRAPTLGRASGVRDRAMLEVFYSTALRLSELAHLDVRDIDFGRGTIMVRRGKGGKARVVPLGEAAMEWLRRYFKEVRPRWASKKTLRLWVGQEGKSVSTQWIQKTVRCLGRKAGIRKPVTPHALRRTCATHLLASGASAWAVKGILGHADFKSLGRYVSLGTKELREMHEKTHPRL
jgi:integrase/recombinase XerD